MPLTYDKLAVQDDAWLATIRESFNLAEQAKKIGIPLHDSLDSVATNEELLFNPTCLFNVNINQVRRIILGAALRIKPNAYIKAYAQADLLRLLMDKDKSKQTDIHKASMIFVYDCAVFGLKDWEQRLIGELVMKRRVERLHIAFLFEFNREYVREVYGKALYTIITNYCACVLIEEEKEYVEDDN